MTTPNNWVNALISGLDETFVSVHGMYLDRGDSLLPTLEGVSAEEASRQLAPGRPPIAAHVEHMTFYFDVIAAYARGNPPEKVDWQTIWRERTAVTPEEWDTLRAELRAAYERTRELLVSIAATDGAEAANGAVGMVAHNAYHLGEIRQMLGLVRVAPPA